MAVSVKWDWRAYTTNTVRDICTFTVLVSVSRPFFQTCLWSVLYVALSGPGCLMKTIYKYSMLLLFTDIIFIIFNHLSARFFFGDCRSFPSDKNALICRSIPSCRVLAPFAQGVSPVDDLAFLCRFGKNYFWTHLFPEYVNIQTFYGALSMSIYRDFIVRRVCQFTEMLWCPEYDNLQRFYGAPSTSIYRDFTW